ncbi:hypothetical protein J3R83DRAFT_9395 [Lanmaoa asiatica]|nr:hypothetical protein J3R83DRAFT_9395 [Lanmaoa asiatica]
MSHVWASFGTGIDGNNSQVKTSLITQNAYGVVLDIGAGKILTRFPNFATCSHRSKGAATQPNISIPPASLSAAGFSESSGTFVLLACGAKDTTNHSDLSERLSTRRYDRVCADALFGARASGDHHIACFGVAQARRADTLLRTRLESAAPYCSVADVLVATLGTGV